MSDKTDFALLLEHDNQNDSVIVAFKKIFYTKSN